MCPKLYSNWNVISYFKKIVSRFPLFALNLTSKYLDGLLNIGNPYFKQMVSQIYPTANEPRNVIANNVAF